MSFDRHSTVPRAAALLLLTVLAYLPAFHGGFVFDDSTFITNNRLIKASDGLYRFWFTRQAPDYYPLTWSLWWLEWRLWGSNSMGYHAVNVLLHAVNAVLVWLVLRRLKIPGAWLASLVFAVHPVNVATVAWISEQKNTLSMLFYLTSILLYLRFDEATHNPLTLILSPIGGGRGDSPLPVRGERDRVRGRSPKDWSRYCLSLVAFLLALLSKTAVVMLPVVLLLSVWWMHGRIRRQDVLRSLPFFALASVFGMVTIWFQHHGAMAGQEVRVASFAERLAGAGWVPWFYLYKALLPFGLCMNYPQWQVDPSRWISYGPGIALVVCFVVFWWKRQMWGRPLLFASVYFVAMLFPVLGFFDQGFYRYSLVADHWQYFAIIAPIALVVGAAWPQAESARRAGDVSSATPTRRPLPNAASGDAAYNFGRVAAAVLVLTLAVATWRRCEVFASEETLWRDTLAKNPRSWLAHTYVGTALMQAGQFEEAFVHYEHALQLQRDYAPAHYNEGLILWQTGRAQEAIAQWKEAVRIRPDYYPAYNNLGFAMLQAGRVPEAIEYLQQAEKINPDIAETHYNLGRAFTAAGLSRAAIEQYQQALQIRPDYVEACNNLAFLLATAPATEGGNPDRAMLLAQRACELTGYRAPAYLDTLAFTLAATGRFSDAVATAQKAIDLARASGQTQLADGIAARLEQYRAGRASR